MTTTTGTYYAQVETFRRALIVHMLDAMGWNHLRTARELGMQPTYLYRLRRKYGLMQKEHGPSA